MRACIRPLGQLRAVAGGHGHGHGPVVMQPGARHAVSAGSFCYSSSCGALPWVFSAQVLVGRGRGIISAGGVGFPAGGAGQGFFPDACAGLCPWGCGRVSRGRSPVGQCFVMLLALASLITAVRRGAVCALREGHCLIHGCAPMCRGHRSVLTRKPGSLVGRSIVLGSKL